LSIESPAPKVDAWRAPAGVKGARARWGYRVARLDGLPEPVALAILALIEAAKKNPPAGQK
jgi:hypothetical protein